MILGADQPVVTLSRNGSTSVLSSPTGAFHRTKAPVLGLREIRLANSQTVVIQWSEGRQPYYAISLDRKGIQRVTPGDTKIDLKYAAFDPLVSVPMVPTELAADSTNRMFIVQFESQPLQEYRDAIEALGGEIAHYLPHHAYLVVLPVGAESRLAEQSFVRWVGPYEPAYRIEPKTLQALLSNELGIQDYYIQIANASPARKNDVATEIRKLGGRIIENPVEGSLMLAELTPDQVRGVARIEGVVYFDQRTEVGNDGMVNVRNTSGANYVESVAGFTGQGVVAHLIDSGIRQTHDAFDTPTNRVTVRLNSTDTSHGTSCSGIVFGNGTGNAAGRGMLPNASGVFTRYTTGGWAARLSWTQATVDTYNAVVESNSWGDALTGLYTTVSAQMDEIIFSTDLLICQSMSNAGTNTGVRPQAWAKNIVSVGGVYHFGTAALTDDRWQSGASVGPAADGRIKPDLAFFYDQITTTSNGSDTSYTTSFGGTSAATPQTAGTFGLLFQMWGTGIFGNPVLGSTIFANRPKSTLAKAMMINGATQYVPGANGNDITRVRQGWGLPSLQSIYDGRDDAFHINERDVLTNLQTKTYRLYVPAGAPSLKATLVYIDRPAAASANPTRLNDLNLRITAPGGAVYNGNVGLSAGVWSTSGGTADSLNTTENVFVQSPASGVWTIEVIGANINSDARTETPGVIDADYALVVNGADAQAPMTSFAVGEGSAFTGSLANLHLSDNAGVTVFEPTTADFLDERRILDGTTTVPTTGSTELRVALEAKTPGLTTGVARVALFNTLTNSWEDVTGDLALLPTDRSFDVVVANGSRFINASRQVRVRVAVTNTSTAADSPWAPVIDQLRITQFQP